MTASPSQSSTAGSVLSSFIGIPFVMTRAAHDDAGDNALAMRALDGCWLEPPEIGKPMCFVVGDSLGARMVRTSPVATIDAEDPERGVIVCTAGARYRFSFGARKTAFAA